MWPVQIYISRVVVQKYLLNQIGSHVIHSHAEHIHSLRRGIIDHRIAYTIWQRVSYINR